MVSVRVLMSITYNLEGRYLPSTYMYYYYPKTVVTVLEGSTIVSHKYPYSN